MRSFDEILAIAVERHGSREAVLGKVSPPKSAAEIAAVPDADWLAAMARSIFQAGISWKVVDAKWPGILEAFGNFDVPPLALMSDDGLHEFLSDPRVIRSGPKIAAIRDNAAFISRINREGGFARRVADWPGEDFGGLLIWLQKEGARLGGATGAYVLRQIGKDGWMPSRDVAARLAAEGVISGNPASAKALHAAGAAIWRWSEEAGLPLKAVSRVLALSIDG